MAQLLGIHIKNFKCLKEITLGKLSNTKDDGLTNLTSIVGSNGSGKSSIFEIFSFISDCLKYGVDDACIVRGGLSHLISKDSSCVAQEEQFTKSTSSSLITENTPSTSISATLTASTLKATTSSTSTGATPVIFEFFFKGRDDSELITYRLSVGYSQIDPENAEHDEKENNTLDDAKAVSAQSLLVSPSQNLSTTTGRDTSVKSPSGRSVSVKSTSGRSVSVKSTSGRAVSAISSANLATSNLANSTSGNSSSRRAPSISARSVSTTSTTSTTSTASTRLSSNLSTDVKATSTSALYLSSVSSSSSTSGVSSTSGLSSSCLSSTSNSRPCILQESLIKTVKDKASGSKDHLLMSFTKGKGVVFSDLCDEVNSDTDEIHKYKIVILEDRNHLAISSVNKL